LFLGGPMTALGPYFNVPILLICCEVAVRNAIFLDIKKATKIV
jgi:hypothetical protein